MRLAPSIPFLTLAPLRGVTVAVFRRRLARHFGGFDAALAPFIPTVAGERIRPGMLRDVERAAGRDALSEEVVEALLLELEREGFCRRNNGAWRA